MRKRREAYYFPRKQNHNLTRETKKESENNQITKLPLSLRAMPLGRRRKSARRASIPAVASRCDGTSEDNHVPDRAVSPPPLAEVMVKRNLLATCVTCLLCKGLLSDATTIPECLHTFCRKCILKKLVDEEEECCPICKTHLGSSPVDKLRADHHLQYIREKIFPLKRKIIVATDSNPNPNPDPNPTAIPNSNSNPNPLPQIQVQVQKVKKERSLSSLVTENTKRLKASRMPVSLTKSKSKDKLSHFTNGSAQKKAKTIEQKQEKETSPPVLMTYARRQINSDPEGSNSHTPRQHSETKGPIRNKPESEVSKCKVKSETENIEGDDERKNGENTQKIAKRNNINGTRKRSKVVGQSLIGTQPVWFSLVASPHPEGGMDLPQLPANYLRIKDDTMKVSSLEKYIKNKLGLSDETEVEIMCRGQCIDPETTLQSLINMWIRNESSNKVKTLVGSSAKDFIMVLMYHLKS